MSSPAYQKPSKPILFSQNVNVKLQSHDKKPRRGIRDRLCSAKFPGNYENNDAEESSSSSPSETAQTIGQRLSLLVAGKKESTANEYIADKDNRKGSYKLRSVAMKNNDNITWIRQQEREILRKRYERKTDGGGLSAAK
jgi:hypothetical protein